MNQEAETANKNDGTNYPPSKLLPRHPKTTKPPYYHPDTKTHQEEVGRFFHKRLVRRIAFVARFSNKYNGIFTAVGTVIIAIFTGFLYSVSNQQAEIVSNQLKIMQLDERPWIALQSGPELTSPLKLITSDWADLDFSITIKNVGKSPAKRVGIVAQLVPQTQQIYFAEEQDRICPSGRMDAAALPKGARFVEFTMFQGDSYTRGVWATNGGRKITPMNGGGFDVHYAVIGCIFYTFTDDYIKHRTGFVFDINKVDNSVMRLNVGEQYAVEQLRINFDMGGNGPAD